ncbi:MAG: hypothetical protein MZV65_53155 [Chromatiales bacterium]|nr:hypothetical protein [Chromatiales bacterium]
MRRLHDGGRGPVRRQGHDDAAVPATARPCITAAPTTTTAGVYYRPYTYHGVHHYYPVPVPYYAYYPAPPVGAIIVMVAGIVLHDGQGRQLQQADDEQRGQGRLPVRAPAPGRQHQDAARRARAGDGVRARPTT